VLAQLVITNLKMHVFKDSVDSTVGIAIFHNGNEEDKAIIISKCEAWFTPIHSITLFEDDISRDNLISLLTNWSEERKEYRIVLILSKETINIDEQVVNEMNEKYTMRIIQVQISGSLEDTLESALPNQIYQNAKDLPRSKSGKQLNVMPVPIKSSTLCVWHRPSNSHAQFKLFHEKNNISDIVCLLNEKEGTSKYAEYALAEQTTWHWLPLQGANIPYLSNSKTQILIVQMCQDTVDMLNGKEGSKNILIHCSAGCHRTGFFAYAVLRILGNDPLKARAGLLLMRRETGVDVGEHRLKLCEQMLEQHEYCMLKKFTQSDQKRNNTAHNQTGSY
jgi:hypothetical protein